MDPPIAIALTSKALKDLDRGEEPAAPNSPCGTSAVSTSVGSHVTSFTASSAASSSAGAAAAPPPAPAAAVDTGAEAAAALATHDMASWLDLVAGGRVEDAQELIRSGNQPPRQLASRKGNMTLAASACLNPTCALEMLRLLVEQCGLDSGEKDRNHQTPLFYAVLDTPGSAGCLEYLLAQGLDPQHVDLNLQTPLYYAAREGNVGAIRSLVAAQADVNHADRHKETALFWAKDRATCRALVEARLDPRVKSASKMTAVEVMQRTGAPDDARNPFLKQMLRLFPPRNASKPELGHMMSGDGLYTVRLGETGDTRPLVALEQEFIDDHVTILDEERQLERSRLGTAIGVKGDLSWRREVVGAILDRGSVPMSQLQEIPMRWTLVCRHYPSNEIVGYVHYSLEEEPVERSREADGQPQTKNRRSVGEPTDKRLYIGYVKVAHRHQRKNVASLLLAAVPKHLAKVAERARKTHPRKHEECEGFAPFIRSMSLSVVESNVTAVSLYRKFGFAPDLTPSSLLIDKGISVRWCKMLRDSEDTFNSLVKKWDTLITSRMC